MSGAPRIVAWFSCGAASAVAAKLAVEKYGDRASVVYCDTMLSEHPDNQRFFDDVQNWIGAPITRIRSQKYASVDDVFAGRRYMSGIAGAPCTVEMKKMPRFDFQRGDDIHVFGFTADETGRIKRLEQNNPELYLEWILRDQLVTKPMALWMIGAAGIKLPTMYALGFKNNNCLGCVKATSSAYWNATRQHFPATFGLRARQSRELGVRLVRHDGERIFLDELPALPVAVSDEDVSCGPECATEDEETP